MEQNKSTNKTLSATDIVNAWYIGLSVKSNVISAKGLMASLKRKGLSKTERKEVVRNAL